MNAGPVFFQDTIEKQAPAVLGCLARLVNELLLLQASGVPFEPRLQAEVQKAIGLIMRATAPPECPVALPQKDSLTVDHHPV